MVLSWYAPFYDQDGFLLNTNLKKKIQACWTLINFCLCLQLIFTSYMYLEHACICTFSLIVHVATLQQLYLRLLKILLLRPKKCVFFLTSDTFDNCTLGINVVPMLVKVETFHTQNTIFYRYVLFLNLQQKSHLVIVEQAHCLSTARAHQWRWVFEEQYESYREGFKASYTIVYTGQLTFTNMLL